jgi:hypothetical protein
MFWWQSLAASGTTIGFLSARSASGDTHLVAAFRQGLAEAPGVLAASQTFTTSQAGRGRRQEGQLSLATNVRPGSITSFRAQASTSALPRRLDLLDTDRLFGTTQDHGSSPLADDHDVVFHRFSFHALPSPASPGFAGPAYRRPRAISMGADRRRPPSVRQKSYGRFGSIALFRARADYVRTTPKTGLRDADRLFR